MFFPVVVLVAILPGLYALRNWDLTPPGPWWGLRGLAVLEGNFLDQTSLAGLPKGPEARTYQLVALQPPLYAWLEALFLRISPDRTPVATVLPSYAAGALVVILIYLLGKLWRGPGVGLVAAVITAFNRALLVQMQQATPTTCGLAGALAAVLSYGYYLESREGRRIGWIVLGGLSLGLSLLSVGAFGLLVLPVILLHRAFLSPSVPEIRSRHRWRDAVPVLAGASALAIGLILAAPWHAMMIERHGRMFLAALMAPPQADGADLTLLARLIDLAPATLPLALFAAARSARRLLTAEGEDRQMVGGALCMAWLAVAAVAPSALSRGPRPALNLFLLMPLNLMAASAIVDLSGRRIAARTLCWLAPASAVTVAWWTSAHVREAVADLIARRSPDAASVLGMHLALDLVLVMAVAVRGLDRWARRRDDRRLTVLGVYLGAVLAITMASGLREVRFRHRETADLLALRDAILRREAARPFSVMAVVGPAVLPGDGGVRPGGRLRFLLRATLPRLAQIDLIHTEDLRKLPGGQRLIIITGAASRLDYASQAGLGLEAIHPGRSGVLEAFATRDDSGKLTRR